MYVHRDNALHMQSYAKGKPDSTVAKKGKTTSQGTVVLFQPDETIFESTQFSMKWVVEHIRQQAYLVPNVYIHIIDARSYTDTIPENIHFFDDLRADVSSYGFRFTGGVSSLVRYHNTKQKAVHSTIFLQKMKKTMLLFV